MPPVRLLPALALALCAVFVPLHAGAGEVEDVASVYWEPYAPDPHTRYLLHFEPETERCPANDLLAHISVPDAKVLGEPGTPVAEGRFGRGLRVQSGTLMDLGGWIVGKLNDLGDKTVECWVRVEKLPQQAAPLAAFLFRRPAKGAPPKRLELLLLPSGKLGVRWENEIVASELDAGDLHAWQHLALAVCARGADVVDTIGCGDERSPGEQATLYINGRRLWGMPLRSNTNLSFRKILLGSGAAESAGFSIVLDEVRVSDCTRCFAMPSSQEKGAEGTGLLLRVRDPGDLLFHLDFDQGLQPRQCAAGTSSPLIDEEEERDPFRYGRGLEGRALRLTARHPEELRYSGEGNLRSDAGTVSLWLMPVNWSNRLGRGYQEGSKVKAEEKGWLPLFEVAGKNKTLMRFDLLENPPYLNGIFAPFRPGQWIHLALTWRGTERAVYVNGKPWAHKGYKQWRSWRWENEAWEETGNLELLLHGPERPLLLDDFRVYARPLAQEEIANLAVAPGGTEGIKALPAASVEIRRDEEHNFRVVVAALGPDHAQARRCRVTVVRQYDNSTAWEGEAELTARGDAVVPLPFAKPYDYGDYSVVAAVTDAQGKELGMARAAFTRTAPDWWDCDVSFFPSYNRISLRLDTNRFQPPLASDSAALRLLRDGKEFWTGALALTDGKGEAFFDVPELIAGKYVLEVLPQGARTPLREPWLRKVYPWETERLGITTKVYPPFTPIEVEGGELSVALRRYGVGPLGLWDKVTARGQDEDSPWLEVLAAPMALKANGQALSGTGEFTATAGHEAVYEGTAQHPAVTVKTKCTTEYDGCMKVELNLLPPEGGAQQLSDLVVEIPLSDTLARLWHVCSVGLRDNPVGAVPEGTGDFWDSALLYSQPYTGKFSSLPTGWNTPRQRNHFFGMFIPYIWLGDHVRGLAWFADNDAGWVTDPEGEKPCLSLHRAGGELRLRVHLVQTPTVLKEPRSIVFGLMASPAKPMRPDWRQWGGGREEIHKGWKFSMNFWSSVSVNSGRYPFNKDYELIDTIRKRRLGGDIRGYLEDVWTPKNVRPHWPRPIRGRFIGFTKLALDRAPAPPTRLLTYYEVFCTSALHEETGVFGYEWSGGAFSGNYIRDYCGKGVLDEEGNLLLTMSKVGWERLIGNSGAPSYIDFVCWHGAKLLERGQGLYFDNAFLKQSRHTVVTAAYERPRWRLEGGRGSKGKSWAHIQPSALVWWHREYFKRMWVLEQERMPQKARPWLEVHMTNANILPYICFMDSSLDLEWWASGPKIMQKRYSPELLQTQTTGLHTGNVPKALMNLPDEMPFKEDVAVSGRTRFGTMAVHEIRNGIGGGREGLWSHVDDFGYALPDCDVINYWDHDNPLVVKPAVVKTLLLKRGGKLLLVLCSWSSEGVTAVLRATEQTLFAACDQAIDLEYPAYSDKEDDAIEALIAEEGGLGDGELIEGAALSPEVEMPRADVRRANISGAFGYQGAIEFAPGAQEVRVPLAPYGVRVIRIE